MPSRERVTCPHCGAENPKSVIVTTCHRCRGSLQIGEQAGLPVDSPKRPVAVGSAAAPPFSAAEPVTLRPESRTEPAPVAPTPVIPPAPELPTALVGKPTATAPAPPPPVVQHTSDQRPLSGPTVSPIGYTHKRRQAALLALAAGFIVFCGLMIALGGASGLSLAAVLLILVIPAALIARAYITGSTYTVTVDAPPNPQALGGTFRWGVSIMAHRELVVSSAQVTIRCQEHAIGRSGDNTGHYRQTIYEQHFPQAGIRLQPGEQLDIRPQITIPASAIPSYEGHNHRIEWLLELTAVTEGFSADVRKKTTITVLPVVSEPGHPSDPHIPTQWLASAPIFEGQAGQITPGGIISPSGEALKGIAAMEDGLTVALEIAGGVSSDRGPLIPAGATRELKLLIEAQEEIRCRSLRVGIGCHIHGKGTRETLDLSKDESVWQGDLTPSSRVEVPIRVSAPAAGPITYQGRYVSFDWRVRVRVDVPLWRDRVLELPFIVTPQAVQSHH